MRVIPAVEEDQVSRVRPDDCAVPVDRIDVSRGRIMRENELATRAGALVGTEEKTGQRIRINMAFESHRGSALNVKHDAVSIIPGGPDRFSADRTGQVEKIAAVRFVEPWQAFPHLACVDPAARYMPYLR